MLSASDYNPEQAIACESVILELHRILGEYWEHVVIVGGYAPALLANNDEDPHKGTNDVDLALNHLLIPEESYEKIHVLLTEHGYSQNDDRAKQFQYFRKINLGNRDYTVVLDLLTGEYDGTAGKNRRHEPIQDVHALKARGVDLVFSHHKIVTISGELPNKGGKHSADCKVAGIAPILAMKCAAMVGRYKDKDAYDIYYLVKYYKKGVESIFEEIKPDLNHGLIREAFARLNTYFSEVDSTGPSQVARFLEADEEYGDIVRREAFELIQDLIQKAYAEYPNKSN